MSEQITSSGQAEEAAVAASLAKLDKACEATVEALKECAEHVQAGRLNPDAVMLKMHQLMASLNQ